jgi:hypothetical protein
MDRGYLKHMRSDLYIPSILRLKKNIKVFAKKIIFFLFFCVSATAKFLRPGGLITHVTQGFGNEKGIYPNHTNITNKTGISGKKFVLFAWLMVKFLVLRPMS